MEPTTRIELVTSSLPRTRSYQLSYVGPTLERETGIEPATNSLEGCDSTTELLPPAQGTGCRASARTAGMPGQKIPTASEPPKKTMPHRQQTAWLPLWWREEDSNLRSSQGAADLQSAAINHSAISPRLKTCALTIRMMP